MNHLKTDRNLSVYEIPKEEHGYPEGLKWTKQRKAVYDVLKEAKEPMNAVQLYREVEKQCVGDEYALSTIYRILAAFEEKGLVDKDTGIEEGTIYYSLNDGSHTHYAVCLECHKRIPLQSCPFAHIHLENNTDEFTITNHKLEIYGYCKDCKGN